MPTFEDLPVEVRGLIYEQLFAGRKFKYVPPAIHNTRSSTNKKTVRDDLSITSILCVNRKSLAEARPALLRTATVNIPRLVYTVRVHSLAFIEPEPLFLLAHVVLPLTYGSLAHPKHRSAIQDSCTAVWSLLNAMPCLKSVILDLDYFHLNYDTTNDDQSLARQAIEDAIRNNTHFALGWWWAHASVKQAVVHWRARNRSFSLHTRQRVYGGDPFFHQHIWVSYQCRLSFRHPQKLTGRRASRLICTPAKCS